MDAEIESTIAAAERSFDRCRDRARELENALRGAENSLERSMVEFNREKIRMQIRRIESDLAATRIALSDARTMLESAWSLRNGSQQNGENAANSGEEKNNE